MDLIKEFENRIVGTVLHPDQQYLLAVSGGMDSMCLANILQKTNIPFEVAHCNFGLRAEESDGDESFVRDHCDVQGLQIHVKHFEIKEGRNIQEKARDLRYNWFRELLNERGLAGIITAHHADDGLETFFINLLRGSGLKGLSGMDYIQGDIFRPLLFAGKVDIEAYVKRNDIEYRSDSSNQSDKYLRNRIRHELLPLTEQIRPGVKEVLKKDQENFRIQLKDLEAYYELLAERCVVKVGEQILINKSELGILEQCSGFLEYVLEPLGFSRDSVLRISNLQQLKIGKQFHSSSHLLTVDREALIITPKKAVDQNEMLIQEQDTIIDRPIPLEIKVLEKPEQFTQNEKIAQFDLAKVSFPLTLRMWREGDRLVPLGMTGSKLVSDLLINIKMPRNEKEKTFVLCSDDKIMWVLGVRISEVFKVNKSTNKVLHIHMV